MSASTVEGLYKQARIISKDELSDFYTNLTSSLQKDDGNDCVSSLRQLLLVLLTSEEAQSIPKSLSDALLAAAGEQNKSSEKFQALCSAVLKQVVPDANINIPDVGPPVPENQVPYLIPVILCQGADANLKEIVPQVVRMSTLLGGNVDIQASCLTFLCTLVQSQREAISDDHVHIINSHLAEWLFNASVEEAPNPYSRGIFKKESQALVTEPDGSVCRDFFTLLNIGKYYSSDQLLNICSFSMLHGWLLATHTGSGGCEGDSSSQDSTLSSASLARRTSGKVKSVLLQTTVDYCFRIIDQCDRKAKTQQDMDLQFATLSEVLSILDTVCKRDETLLPKVFDNIRRLFGRSTMTNPRIKLQILQFYLNFSQALVYDAEPAYDAFFTKTLAQNYANPGLAFDVVLFLRDNLENLCYNTHILSRFFPNLFKILAWDPRSFVADFMDILPAMMSPNTSIEIFHTLLDLPCLTATLELSRVSLPSDQVPPSGGGEGNSLEAFRNPVNKPFFNFILRNEGGRGDTIDRLERVHYFLKDMCRKPRVVYSCQALPVLLSMYVNVILEDGDYSIANKLFPVLLERVGLLYNVTTQEKCRSLLSDCMVRLVKKYPQLLMEHCAEIKEYIGSIRNIDDKEDFFVHLVWLIGEYSRATFDERCSPEVVTKFYELLEALVYEVSGLIQATPTSEPSPYSARLVSAMMSALAKLASRCQDLIPRVLLCLTKVTQQHTGGALDEGSRQVLLSRANQLINLMKSPNVAAVVLSPPQDLETGMYHRDNTSLPTVVRSLSRLLRP